MHNLLRQLLIVTLIFTIICMILIESLFNYYENYIQREEAKIIYEIEPSVIHLEAKVEAAKSR
ncbi:MAG: hypothetical protein H9872_00400 [Candidatus Cellulosilyticum pullistercoris]|uniref:Uncharacterized protein n=1 Tax=Candidatus Cellulosilyticum pullistercoris TaxID=2838521 RepID=A0A9E2NMA9_9FIRM|nr:hypothetical protein [Candidatus Cellulosilyticum pullistercoris]